MLDSIRQQKLITKQNLCAVYILTNLFGNSGLMVEYHRMFTKNLDKNEEKTRVFLCFFLI